MTGRMLKSLRSLWLLAVLLPAQAQEVYYIHTDALGSPVAETDANRNVVARFEYEPYGQRIGPGNDDKPGYTGHVMDAVTGLVQMQQRSYDPGIGVFLSVDPVTAYGQPFVAFNRYRYANSNPYKFTDPDGRFGSSIERAIERDIMARAQGEISTEEYFDRAEARAAGGVAGLAILAGARSPSILRGILKSSLQRAVARQVARRPDGVPKSWERTPSKDGKGYTWRNPENKHDSVRTSTGNPNSSQPGQREPYVVRQTERGRYDANGKSVTRESKDSHTPLRKYEHKSAEELHRLNK